MAELDEKLNALLSDPASMAQVMQLAQQLSGSFGAQAATPPSPAPSPPVQDLPDMAALAKYLPLLQQMGTSNSRVTQLLGAMQPFLKAEKQDKVQRAAQLAHIIYIGKRLFTEMGGWNNV